MLSISLIILSFFAQATPSFHDPEDHLMTDKKLQAVVFLSASCPCSQSHMNHLKDLTKVYKDVKFWGVITESGGQRSWTEATNTYYQELSSWLSLIYDPDQVLIKKYRALKTPHVTLVDSAKQEPLFEGGLSDHRLFSKSKKHFLADNLKALNVGKPPPHRQANSFGCYIRRL